MGRGRQIEGYIGKPRIRAVAEKEDCDLFIRDIMQTHKGVRVWSIFCSNRLGEYIARIRYIVAYARDHGKEGFFDVIYVRSNYGENVAIANIIDRTIPVIHDLNRDKWYYILKKVPTVAWANDKDLEIRSDNRLYTHDEFKELLVTNAEEKMNCQAKMREMGLEEPFVCFSSRDREYLKIIDSTKDYSYHDYRDSTIENKGMMIDYLASKGIRSVRMGKFTEKRYVRSGSIDFSHDYYDDLMDIYLHERAKFVVEDANGLFEIPITNNGNFVLVNYTPIMCIWASQITIFNGILLFKKEYSREKCRFLTLDEMLEVEEIARFDGHKYNDLGVEMVENTPEEILDAAIEMNERIDGVWEESEEDKERQRLFNEFKQRMMARFGYCKSQMFQVPIGSRFLEKNWEIFGLSEVK